MTPSVFATMFVVFAATFIAIGLKIGAVFRAWRLGRDAESVETAKATWMLRIFNAAMVLVFLAAWGFVAFGFGAYITAIGMYDRLAEDKLATAKEVLGSEKAMSIEVSKTSDGHIWLSGSVDAAVRDQLLERFRFNFGDSEAKEMMQSVKVNE